MSSLDEFVIPIRFLATIGNLGAAILMNYTKVSLNSPPTFFVCCFLLGFREGVIENSF
jgi:hypothetical protein